VTIVDHRDIFTIASEAEMFVALGGALAVIFEKQCRNYLHGELFHEAEYVFYIGRYLYLSCRVRVLACADHS
jgi:hypothetical protein